MASLTEAELHRDAVQDIATLAIADLVRDWRRLDVFDPARASRDVEDLMVTLSRQYGDVAAGFAAEWYEDRRVEAGVPSRFTARPGSLPPVEQVGAIARWGVGPLWSRESPDPDLALSKLSGGLQRMVADADRTTTWENARRDPAGVRYMRLAAVDACAFCAMLSTRGGVYRSEGSASGQYHDHCRCSVEAVFPGESIELPPRYQQWADEYGRISDNLREQGMPVTQSNVLPRMRQSLGLR